MIAFPFEVALLALRCTRVDAICLPLSPFYGLIVVLMSSKTRKFVEIMHYQVQDERGSRGEERPT